MLHEYSSCATFSWVWNRICLVRAIWRRFLVVVVTFQVFVGSALLADEQFEWLPNNPVWHGNPGEFTINSETMSKETFLYRLFVPSATRQNTEGAKYPIIVWLHGHGKTEFMNPNYGHLVYIPECLFEGYASPETANFFVLAVQCPSMDRPWLGEQPVQEDGKKLIEPGEAVALILDNIIAEHPVDINRIGIVGISSGANAAWELAMRYPDKFSAMVLTGSAGTNAKRLSRIKDLPIWAFYNAKDSDRLKHSLNETITRLTSADGICKATEVLGAVGVAITNHDAWHEAFREHGALSWILSQERQQIQMTTRLKWWYHEYGMWRYLWPRLVVASIVGCLIFFARKQLRERNASTAHSPSLE
jgi:predicted esterase